MPAPSTRRPALDGLRGLAALVVVMHHSLLVAPSLANGYNNAPRPAVGSWPWLALYTPLHLVWAGGEAVLIFFVLSGLVLALPAAQGRSTIWRGYYVSRTLRLYMPIGIAIMFALLLVRLVPRHPPASSSWWLASHTSPIGFHEAIHDAAVVKGTSWLNSALWSLQWKVIFSALLPLYVLVLVRRGRASIRLLGLVVLLIGSTWTGHASVLYLPIFGLGVVMAQQLARLDALGVGHDALRGSVRVLIVVTAGCLLVARWWLSPFSSSHLTAVVGLLLTLLGACLVVWLFTSTAGAKRVGTTRPVKWLGKRSFSLYLMHEPIVVTTAYLLGGTRNAALVLLIALPVSLAAAEVFGRYCEEPSHRLARATGDLLRPRTHQNARVRPALAD